MAIVRRAKEVKAEDLAALLKYFFENTKVKPDGAVQFLLHDYENVFEILPDAFDLPPKLTAREVTGLLRRALLDCRKAGKQDEDALLKRVEKLAKAQLAKKPAKFTMWTKFRARQMAFAPGFNITWQGVTMRARSKLPPYLRVEKYFINGFGDVDPSEPSFFGYIIVSCRERDAGSAVERMLDALQVFYGLFNLYARFGQITHHIGLHWTDGPLWLGPFQLDFQGKKFLSEERVWYNPDYLYAAWNRHPLDMSKIHKRIPKAKKALKLLEKHPLRDVLVRAILLMQDGFAARDNSHRLLRYWSALEQLYSDDPRNRNQRSIVQRASFAEPSPALEKWSLNHAARLRNEHVHAGRMFGTPDASIEYVRDVLSRHINHLIFVRGDLRNHAEWLELVDLPSDAKTLDARKDTIDKRLTYFK